jgi:hypothetical protein
VKFKVGTTAYQRKTKTQRDVIVTIVIDETALARVRASGRSTTVRKKARCCAASSEVGFASCKAVGPERRWDLSGCGYKARSIDCRKTRGEWNLNGAQSLDYRTAAL